MTTLVISHPACLAHEMGEGHPERPDRLRVIERGHGLDVLPDDLRFPPLLEPHSCANAEESPFAITFGLAYEQHVTQCRGERSSP